MSASGDDGGATIEARDLALTCGKIVRPYELARRARLVARRIMATRWSQPHWNAWMIVAMDERRSRRRSRRVFQVGES